MQKDESKFDIIQTYADTLSLDHNAYSDYISVCEIGVFFYFWQSMIYSPTLILLIIVKCTSQLFNQNGVTV